MNLKGDWQYVWSAMKYYFYPIKKLHRKCAKCLWSHILIIANPWHKTLYSYNYYELEQKSLAVQCRWQLTEGKNLIYSCDSVGSLCSRILKCGNILQCYSFPSGTHGTGQVPDRHIFQIIIQYLYWPKFLQVIFCYCLQSMCTCQLFSFNHKKDSSFSIIIGPFMGFPSECLSVDQWFNT